MSLSNKKIKGFNKFFENNNNLGTIVNKDDSELIRMELLERLEKTGNSSEIKQENYIKIDLIMRNLCDIFSESGINNSKVSNYIFNQKDFDFGFENDGIYIFESDEDEDTFMFDLINRIDKYNDFND